MNINIVATGTAIFPNNKAYPVHETFKCWQTQTKVTEAIENSEDPIASYIEWISKDIENYNEEVEIHDFESWDEETGYFKVIGKRTVNYRKTHISDLQTWLEDVKEKGLTVEVYGA